MQAISRQPALFGFKEVKMFGGALADLAAKYGTGVQLCDGTNGTPDLRDRFIVGAKQDDTGVAKTNITGALTKSGGSVTIAIANMPAHDHPLNSCSNGAAADDSVGGFSHPDSNGVGTQLNNPGWAMAYYDTDGNGNDLMATTGGGQAYTQPYYALCFITRTADWA